MIRECAFNDQSPSLIVIKQLALTGQTVHGGDNRINTLSLSRRL